jgi:hypothetical protein
MQITDQSLQEMKDAIVVNTEAIAKLEGQIGHLVAEYNRIKEEEFQSQLMAKRHYMMMRMMLEVFT